MSHFVEIIDNVDVCASSLKLLYVLQACHLSLFAYLFACCLCVYVHPVTVSTFVSSCVSSEQFAVSTMF